MTCNPNLAYGLTGMPQDWLLQTLEWNTLFRKWFSLQVDDTAVEELIDHVGLLFWTADRHLWFGVSSTPELDRILTTVEELGPRWGLRPAVEPASLEWSSRKH